MSAFTKHGDQVTVIPGDNGERVELVKDPASIHHTFVHIYGIRGGLKGTARLDLSDLRAGLLLAGVGTRRETIRHAERVATALIDDWDAFDAGVSPIYTLAILVRDYENSHDWDNDEDPDATGEMVTECKHALCLMKESLTKARAALAARQRQGAQRR